jgi:diaminopimelate epimerase
MLFYKYTALGNDYLVLDARKNPLPSKGSIVRVCDRHFGIGSDGLLYGGEREKNCFPLRIFNPDGSEAEKSGNGIRIFARFLWDRRYSRATSLSVRVPSGDVLCSRHTGSTDITVEMGIPQWNSPQLPSPCDQLVELDGQSLEVHAVSMGNPHAVLCSPVIGPEAIRHYGPWLENHPLFPQKTNVQLIRVRDRRNIELQIWERGAGYTLASGSSACAAFAVARKLGLCADSVSLHMPGGSLLVRQDARGMLHQTGPASLLADCRWHDRAEQILKEDLKS